MHPTIYTVGHSRHTADHLLGLLHKYDIWLVADVRQHPRSRWAPHFAGYRMAGWLPEADIVYLPFCQELGGRPESRLYYGPDGRLDCALRREAPDFRSGIEQLLHLAGLRRVAIMCAEENPARCHRRLLVAPALQERGALVHHIRGDGSLE